MESHEIYWLDRPCEIIAKKSVFQCSPKKIDFGNPKWKKRRFSTFDVAIYPNLKTFEGYNFTRMCILPSCCRILNYSLLEHFLSHLSRKQTFGNPNRPLMSIDFSPNV